MGPSALRKIRNDKSRGCNNLNFIVYYIPFNII